jgi:hypothetical protein
MLSTVIGAALGSAIDGALGGAAVALAVRAIVPLAVTYATGWLVLYGIGRARDAVFGSGKAAA